MKKIIGCAFAACLLSQAALAQNGGGALPAPAATGVASYVSGGVGSDESAALRAVAPRYPLELLFTRHMPSKEEYTAGVHVKLSDGSGKVLIDTVPNGPIMLIDVPDGAYQVEAVKDGAVKKENVTLKKGRHKRLTFSWDEGPAGG